MQRIVSHPPAEYSLTDLDSTSQAPKMRKQGWEQKETGLKKSPLLLERVDRAQPGTGMEGTPENEEWAPMNAPPPGGRLPLRGRWQGEALTDEGKNLSHSTKPGFIQ